MHNGIIFVNEGIISLDLQTTLSKYYKTVNMSSAAGQSQMDSDFIIIDPDIYSAEELEEILIHLDLNPNVKIIALTSQPEDKLRKSFQCKHVITKPFEYASLLQAIEN